MYIQLIYVLKYSYKKNVDNMRSKYMVFIIKFSFICMNSPIVCTQVCFISKSFLVGNLINEKISSHDIQCIA